MGLSKLREQISRKRFDDETDAIQQLIAVSGLDQTKRQMIVDRATELVHQIRNDAKPGLMEQFLVEYELSTNEGVALMCLAEAYLRTPDALSLDALIRDKIGPGDWGSHRGTAGSFLVNASTWALMLTGRMFKDREPDYLPLSEVMLETLSRLGESLTQNAIKQAMKILGKQFVLGRDIEEALGQSQRGSNKEYRYSYDMLGEAARTAKDADKYFKAYSDAIRAIAVTATCQDVHANPGISIKLSALHPRYEYVQRSQIMDQLVERVGILAKQACIANIGFTIDAEEADRLDLSLDVIEAVMRNTELAGWRGFGVVVQAYLKQAPLIIEWLAELAASLNRQITVRLVKGAYWDYEIKQAQVLGMDNYPVFTRKLSTDVSYLSCAQQLLNASDVIYPQFATHNAHTSSAVIEMAEPRQTFEFQRLHGMGETLHRLLVANHKVPCRIYAPVGVHKDLLAYLVRRLLENGSNSSFVNKLMDGNTPVEKLVSDPLAAIGSLAVPVNPRIPLPGNLYGAKRTNSRGLNLNLPLQAEALSDALVQYKDRQWKAAPMISGQDIQAAGKPVFSPTIKFTKIGEVVEADEGLTKKAFEIAQSSFTGWSACDVEQRAAILEKVADLYQDNRAELIALATLEAGKTRLDGVLEIREAIDFCRYYAAEAREKLGAGNVRGMGPVVCISPWNFPLAIFTGQIAAALVCGNPVLAKPAEQTPLIAARAVELMHQAGVPKDVLQLVPGNGATVGRALTSNPLVKCVCFTGSLPTAMVIDKALAANADPDCCLIAETGGLNTMIVDSTALLEQAVRDIVASAFQSAGQRCSALRILCVQEEIMEPLMEMLEGAARELVIGDPWEESTDVGPVIDEEARKTITSHCERMIRKGRLLFQVGLPPSVPDGYFVSPIAFRLASLDELKQEIFGPVLHVLSFKASGLNELVNRINSSGYGLTMGIHSRVDTRVNQICRSAHVGNIYVNRNQIGAVVGVQPFGGEGLSGTGPKAGGPRYLRRFYRKAMPAIDRPGEGKPVSDTQFTLDVTILKSLKESHSPARSQQLWSQYTGRPTLLNTVMSYLPEPLSQYAYSACQMDRELSFQPILLPGPTGEKNQLSLHGRGIVLCLGGGDDPVRSLVVQIFRSLWAGNLVRLPSQPEVSHIQDIVGAFRKSQLANLLVDSEGGTAEQQLGESDISLAMYDGDSSTKSRYRTILAAREGTRVALVTSEAGSEMLIVERVISTDTTASGGNASLLALGDGDG
ncbi:MAG: bifunctional proline dehydrogenase/L-glutamate gamma-semialdehyde dehydrogenase PutA [Gammaproteobacteria bacterium]|nr:bifunctional proline dehydrogenase/L-glutamate gamma-semialdehyde dehydrogenase PutA [Gammaproteobacteria bacterium]